MKNDELLKSKDFYLYETCRCGGTLQHKWRHRIKVLEVRIFPEQSMFSILKDFRKFAHGKLTDFESKLKLACQ